MDKRYQALFTALASGRGMAPESMLQALSAEGDADPRLEMLAQVLAQQQSARPVGEDDDDDDADDDDDDDDDDVRRVRARQWNGASMSALDRRARLARVRENMAAMREELEDLRETNDALAMALGACYLCWGGEPECPHCAGEGTPGHFMPDPALFDEIVRPAVSRVASAASRRMRATRRTEPGARVGTAPQKQLARARAKAPATTPMSAPASPPTDPSIHSINLESEDPNNH